MKIQYTRILTPGDLNWVQHLVSRIGLLKYEEQFFHKWKVTLGILICGSQILIKVYVLHAELIYDLDIIILDK